MKADVILKKKEDAVSPVIGVMLMLVVTIVIAAVVAAFAGGLGSDVEMAPTAALDIDVTADGNKVKIEHLSGESLIQNEITVKVADASGKVLGESKLGNDGTLSPGLTTTIALEMKSDNAENKYSLNTGDFVTVTILANGKHVVAKKDVLVK